MKISVLMSVFNGEKYLREAIDSILGQTLDDFEFLIVNDASTDLSLEILNSYKDSRLVILNNEENKGLTYNLNYMLSLSKGKYLARMDADDISFPNRLEIQYNYMESHPQIGICGGNIEVFNEWTQKSQKVLFPQTNLEIKGFAFFQSPFCHPSVIIRKEILNKNNLKYPVNYLKGQDYALWIELLKYTEGRNLSQFLLRFRNHAESVSALAEKKEDDKIRLVSNIHQDYLEQNNIFISEEDMYIYTSFVDRSITFPFTKDNQKKLCRIIKCFFKQLEDNEKKLLPSAEHYFSMICFYKYLKAKKVPNSIFLQGFFIKGFIIYIKRIFNH